MQMQSKLAAILAAAVLAACGGGGDSGAGSSTSSGSSLQTNGNTTTTAPVAITVYAATASVVQPAAATDPALNAFNWINYRRAQNGLAPFVRNSFLDKAAAAHVNYMAVNTSYLTEGHAETAGSVGYTGATPAIRGTSAGYATGVAEDMNGILTVSAADAIDGLLDAPYHRESLLGAFADAGSAAKLGGSGLYVVDMGGRNANVGPSASNLVVFPASGQTTPGDWIVRETPSPLPDLNEQRVGYPVSISSLSQPLSVSTFILSDEKGVPLTVRLLTTRTDNGLSLVSYAFIVPLAPLAPGAKYTARATGKAGTTAFDISWSFSTTPVTALRLVPSAPVLGNVAGTAITVTLEGGTGHNFLMAATSSASPAYASIDYLAPGTMKITRNSVPCTTSRCIVTVAGRDSAQTEATLQIAVQ